MREKQNKHLKLNLMSEEDEEGRERNGNSKQEIYQIQRNRIKSTQENDKQTGIETSKEKGINGPIQKGNRRR